MQPVRVALAPDVQGERDFLPDAGELRRKLLLADRGYAIAVHYHPSAADATNTVAEFTQRGISARARRGHTPSKESAPANGQAVLRQDII